jgi:hypothetical protein
MLKHSGNYLNFFTRYKLSILILNLPNLRLITQAYLRIVQA